MWVAQRRKRRKRKKNGAPFTGNSITGHANYFPTLTAMTLSRQETGNLNNIASLRLCSKNSVGAVEPFPSGNFSAIHATQL